MVAPGTLRPQAVIALDIGLGFTAQDQRLRCIKGRPANPLAIDQSVLTVLSTWVFVGTPAARAISTAASTACSSWCKINARRRLPPTFIQRERGPGFEVCPFGRVGQRGLARSFAGCAASGPVAG